MFWSLFIQTLIFIVVIITIGQGLAAVFGSNDEGET